MSNLKFSRRQFLKAGARSAVLALAGPGAGTGARVSDAEITSAVIHPAIGIARVGNSTSGYYFGPELPGALPLAPGYGNSPPMMRRSRGVRILSIQKRPGTTFIPPSTSPRHNQPCAATRVTSAQHGLI